MLASLETLVKQVLSRYEILREIGRGGMGVVYEAHDTRLDRRVAVKALLREDAEPERRRRFRQEARAASALNHQNIITVHDIDVEGDVDYIVMEYVDGVPLSALIEEGPLPIERATRLAGEIAGALAAAHASGIVHRDLKPANVMVTREGRVKVLDFGLSKVAKGHVVPSTAETKTRVVVDTTPGLIVGTGGYMSPEQASGGLVDTRSDVFSFGIVLYEMLSGRRAFSGDSYWSTLRAVLSEEVAPLADARSETPAALRRIVERCLRKNPLERYVSAVELSADLAPLMSPPRRRLRPWIAAHPRAAASVATAAVITTLAAGVPVSRWYAERSLLAGLRDIEERVDRGNYASAHYVARELQRKAPGDPRVERAFLDVSVPIDVRTDPPGAEVFYKDYGDDRASWQRFGTSPVENTRVPFGAIQWKVEKAGFDSVEGRFIWWGDAALRLHPAGSSPSGMVFVPGGPANPLRLPGMRVDDFWLKYEVTNREYKKFVDAGGYRDPRFWTHAFEKDGQPLSWEQAIELLRDKTGRPGPATWELGTYPAGQENYPVGGVSWYEAAAYAQFAGKGLPTVPHWMRATGMSNLRDDIPRGNFASQAPKPIAALKDLGAFGTYGLAGNVKEWCLNPVEGMRYLLGGGWNEPIYMGTALDARPSFDRADTNGFRTVKHLTPPAEAALAEMRLLPRHVSFPPPVSDDVFDAFRSFYAYDRKPLEPKEEETRDSEHWRQETISIAAPYGRDRMLVHLLLPKNAAPPYQAVLYYPGAYAYTLQSSKDLPVPIYFDFIARSGRAVIHPVYQGTYERRLPGGAPEGRARRDMLIDTAKDISRTIDYLQTRPDIDHERIGFYVFSTGIQVLPALALEPRIKTAVFLSGGFGPRARATGAPEIDPINFAPRIKMPVLLLGGRYDFVTPVETGQKPLFERFGTPAADKRHFIFDAGHVPPRIVMIRETLDWLDRQLGAITLR